MKLKSLKKEKIERDTRVLAFSMSRFLSKIPLVKRVIGNFQQKIQEICPYNEDTIHNYTDGTIVGASILGFVAVVLTIAVNHVIMHEFTPYAIALALLIGYIVVNEYRLYKIKSLKTKIISEFNLYLSTFKATFKSTHSVISALSQASADFSYNIKRYASYITELLTAENAETRVKEYVSDPRHPSYIRMFVSQCQIAHSVGDYHINGGSLLCKNIEIIRTEMAEHAIADRDKETKLFGLTFVVVFPALLLNMCGKWCVDFAPNTITYFNAYGYIIQIATLVVTAYIYMLLCRSKTLEIKTYDDDPEVFKKLQKKLNLKLSRKNTNILAKKLNTIGSNTTPALFVTKMIVYGVIAFAASILLTVYVNNTSAYSAIHNSDMTDISVGKNIAEDVLSAIISVSDTHKGDYKEGKLTVSDEILLNDLNETFYIPNLYVKQMVIEEIKNRIDKYNKITFTWYQFLASIVLSIVFAFLPMLTLNYSYDLYNQNKQNEIRLFQTVILIMKDLRSVNTLQILKAMETHANVYKTLLRAAVDEYSYNRDKALRFLRQEQEESFKEIVNDLYSIRRVGVSEAFSELERDIEFSKKKRVLEESIRAEKTKSRLEYIAYIPFVLVIGLYFAVPFMLDSWIATQDVIKQVQTMDTNI